MSSDALVAAAGKIADAVAEFYGVDRDQLVVADTFGAAVIAPETMEPANWASEWARFLPHIRLLADLKVEVMTTVDGNMAVRLRAARPKPITWRRERFAFMGGSVGDLDLFSIGPSTTRGEQSCILTNHLPGGARNTTVPGDVTAAQAEAERLLAEFVERITA